MTISQRVTALPPAPDPAIHPRTEFAQVAAASVIAQRALPGEINNFADQANALAVDLTAKSVAATSAAQIAQAAAADAAATANVPAWVSGTTYAQNVAVSSRLNQQTYRRRVAGAGTTDPANDPTNWAILTRDGAFIPQNVPDVSINLALGNYHTRVSGISRAFTFDNCPSDGFSFTFELKVTGGIATFPTSVRTPDDVPYTLTNGKTHLLMFVTSNRGANWLMVAATNYTT